VGVEEFAIDEFPRIPLEDLAYFVVADLWELLVPGSHRIERVRSDNALDFIRLMAKVFAGLGRAGRHSHHNLAGSMLPNSFTAARMVEPVASPSSTRITI
jgi:hypothetical protein